MSNCTSEYYLITGIFTRKNWWFKTNSISSEEVEFEKILSSKVNVLEIFVGKRRGEKTFELRESIKLFIESEIS